VVHKNLCGNIFTTQNQRLAAMKQTRRKLLVSFAVDADVMPTPSAASNIIKISGNACTASQAMASAEMRQSRSKVKAWIKQIQKQPQDLVTAHVARSRSFDRHARFQQSAFPILPSGMQTQTCPATKQQTITNYKFAQSSSWSSPLDFLGIGGLFEDEEKNQERWAKEDVVMGPDGPINLPIFLLPPHTQNSRSSTPQTVISPQGPAFRSTGNLIIPATYQGFLTTSDNWMINKQDSDNMPSFLDRKYLV
jgi:hypothetical protein